MKKKRPLIYLDYHATTPMDRRVFEKMRPFFLSEFGNASSKNHAYGFRAEAAIDDARIKIAKAINAHPTEIIFTSGATESTNMALKGLFWPTAVTNKKKTLISSLEHAATIYAAKALEPLGVNVEFIKPSKDGLIEVDKLCLDDVAVLSLFFVHNEIGTINPLKEIAKKARENGVLFHCDAAQAMGRVTIDCQELDVDMMSLSSHKVYGPKGMGCLYIKRSAMNMLCPLIHGGGQEWFKRAGTLNTPGIVGMGEAFRLASLYFSKEDKKIKALRDRLLKNLQVLEDVHVNGSLTKRVSGNLNLSFARVDAEELLLSLNNKLALSTSSACKTSFPDGFSALKEIGIEKELRAASVRFGLGRFTTVEEVDVASELIVKHVKRLRKNKT